MCSAKGSLFSRKSRISPESRKTLIMQVLVAQMSQLQLIGVNVTKVRERTVERSRGGWPRIGTRRELLGLLCSEVPEVRFHER